MLRTYRYQIEPNKRQAATLELWIWRCRQIYNAALEQRIDVYRKAGETLSLYDQFKQLTELRAADPEFGAIPTHVLRSALRTLQRAYDGFHRRVKSGQTPGFPRFQGRDRFSSFAWPLAAVDGKKVRVPKLGLMRFRKYRDLGGPVKEARIKRSGKKWWVSFVCDLGPVPAKKPVFSAAGVDVGLKSFAALSDGQVIENPRFLRKAEKELARRQRQLSRRKRGSGRRGRAKAAVGRLHEAVRNRRLDFIRKTANSLFEQFDLVAVEDLNVAGLASSRLSKSVHDASWTLFRKALSDKAECAGRTLIAVDPRGTSQTCSNCGVVVPKGLSVRIHRCACGLVLDRDVNAARNVLQRAIGPPSAGRVEVCASRAIIAQRSA